MAINLAIPASEQLVKQCINGDASAYRMLYDRYSKAMYNTALRIMNRTSDAEDVLQDAFTDAFLQLSSFEFKSTFGAWLKQIRFIPTFHHIDILLLVADTPLSYRPASFFKC